MQILQSAPPAKAAQSSDDIGSHWYSYSNGQWHPLYKEGGTFTLREARKLKDEGQIVVPSVTTIFKLLYKKQLVDWMKANVAKASLVLARADYASDEEYVDAVLARAEGASMGAADLGSRIHKAIENALDHQEWDAELAGYVQPVLTELDTRGYLKGISEACAGSTKYGYAGRVDLNVPGQLTVVDFKSRKSKGKKVASYDTDALQLAAYGFALFGNPFFSRGKGIILAVSTTQPGLLTPHEFEGQDLIQAFEAYLGLCQAWRYMHNFDPRVQS